MWPADDRGSPWTRRDTVLAALLAFSAAVGTWAAAHRLGPEILHYSTWDYWFESDPPAVADQIRDRTSRNHLRSNHHPLSSLVLYAAGQLLARLPGVMSTETIASLLMASVASVWVGVTYLTLRALTLPRGAAAVFTGIAALSACSVFWFPVLEANALGALTTSLAVAVVALSERGRRIPVWLCLLVSLGTLAITTTNWLIGLLMLGAVLPWRRAIAVALATIAATVVLWTVQLRVFPATRSPLVLNTPAETVYLFNPEALGLRAKLAGVFFHATVMPEIGDAHGFRLSIQASSPGSGGPFAAAATALWMFLVGVAGLSIRERLRSRTVTVLLLSAAGQLGVAIVFGVETFFYSLYFGPPVMLIVALGAIGPLRRVVVRVAAALLVALAVNNLVKFDEAADQLSRRFEAERGFTAAILARTGPDDLLLCGRAPASAVGEAPPTLASILARGPEVVLLEGDPDTCYYAFDGTESARRGWLLPAELWSTEAIDEFRRRGARYFVTSHQAGVGLRPDVFGWLDGRFELVSVGAGWRIYDLRQLRPS